MSNLPKRTTTYLISLTLVKVEALSEDEEEEEGEGTPTTTTTTATPALLGGEEAEEVDGSAAEKAGIPEKALVADACVDELVGGDTHREEEMGGVTHREEEMGGVTHREEEMGGVTYREEEMGGVTHREEEVGEATRVEEDVGGATHREEEVGGVTHREEEVGGGATHREKEVGGGATHREEEVGGATHREEEKGGAKHREEEKGGATHREEEKGGATHREEEKGGTTRREDEVMGGATHRDELVGGATHREEEVGGEDTVVQTEEQQLVQRREDQQQEVQPRGSSPVQEDRDDKPKMRQSRGGKPPKDGAFVGRSKKKGSFVPPPAAIKDPMNKASSSSSSAGAPSPSLGGGVRREGGVGPRGSDGILRPKTELYGGPPPPMLFLKGQGGDAGGGGGLDLTTAGRSRCSLPVSMTQEGGATELNAKRSRCSLPVSIPSPRPDLLMRSSHHTPHGSAGGGADTTVCWWDSPRDRRETGPPTKTLDHRRDRDPRLGDHQSPIVTAGTIGPYRASWADSDGGRGTLIRPGPHSISSGGFTGMMTRDGPGVGDKFKTVSVSHQPAPPPTVSVLQTSSRPPKKGKSLTLDNSDLHGVPDDPKTRGRDGGGTVQRAAGPPRDRKMLKFISGIFTKSTTATSGGSPADRRSSEEEGACVTSPEWTFTQPCSPPRLDTVQELHLGVLGGLCSAKSALVHRYMTGSYVALENPDGGQYMKEVLIDGQSHLLIIREETGLPDVQFAGWVDAVILVFSLENEASFQEVYRNYNQLSVHRTITEIPFIVVGTQDKISSSNHRVIDDVRARQLCSDVRRCTYYETCATYGLNVNRVFTDAAQKILTFKKQAALLAACQSLPNSPSHSGGSTPVSGVFPGQASNGGQSSDYSSSLPSTPVISHREICNRTARGGGGDKLLDSPTPGGPAARSATRRRTSRFTGRRGSDTNRRSLDCKGDLGSGRSIPLKQGPLLKRSGSSLNKEWKKKYVTLCNNGVLSYYSSLNDYMQDAPGKEMDLLRVTVKVPGKRPPRAVAACGPHPAGLNGLVKDSHGAEGTSPDSTFEGVSSSSSTKDAGSVSPTTYRKKHRRKKSFNQKGDATIDDEENFDFLVVSSTGQTWHFEALSVEERDSWVQAIESEILASLQLCESSKNKACKNSQTEAVALQAIRNAKGNNFCVDCEAPNPTWASLNLGALICIECSGIHRNLGTHLSRVRSLDLDDLPREMLQVLSAIGNHTVNCIWEGRTLGHLKPLPHATREERESWIRAKYELRLFVAPLPPPGPASSPGDDSISLSGRLLLAVMEHNLPRLLLLLAHCTKEDINAAPTGAGLAGALSSHHPLAYRLPACPLHAACQQADVVMTQLLIWYGCDVRYRDAHGQTALTLARHAGSQECVNILLQYGCPNEPPLPPVLPYHHMEPPLPPVPPYHHMAPTASFNVAAASLTPPRLPHVARTPYTTSSSSHRSGGAATLIHVGSRRAMS